MNYKFSATALGIAGVSVALAVSAQPEPEPREAFAAMFGQIKPVAQAAIDAPAAKLGRALFWDQRLSVNGKIACATCHMPEDGSSDRRQFSTDARDKPTSRHSQPIYNSTLQTAGLRWTGDRASAAAQAEGSMTGSMGFETRELALANLKKHYDAKSFAAAFPGDADPVTIKNMAQAIDVYESTLNTPAPFDRYLAGDNAALTAAQKAGMRTFVNVGCAGCHSGALLGGTLQMKFGLTKDYWLETKSKKVDEGKFAATKNEADKHVFRVAMLRNVVDTAPYFHDGSVAKLDDAVRVMASVQLGRQLTDAETASIVEFLKSLSGKRPANYAPPVN
ncbi:MAG: cytochrome-c peroxidase [Burkholderiales bacterium]|nr:MAG: cytochrome-c peroxidase [Betaproteobacteria bacterium]TAG24847.1 MAG: cytochrome-c peroxidase [Burkholderiales bacterium]